jgi:hypothetical protein
MRPVRAASTDSLSAIVRFAQMAPLLVGPPARLIGHYKFATSSPTGSIAVAAVRRPGGQECAGKIHLTRM